MAEGQSPPLLPLQRRQHQAVLAAAPAGAVAALAGQLGVPPHGLAQVFQPAELAVALDQVQVAPHAASAEANEAEAEAEEQQRALGPPPQRQQPQPEAQQRRRRQQPPPPPPPLHQQPALAPAGQPQQQDLFTQLLDAASAPTAAAAGLTPELVCEFVALLPRLPPAEQADKVSAWPGLLMGRDRGASGCQGGLVRHE